MLKLALVAGLRIGTSIEKLVQVFHRILDLKHGPGFLPGALLFNEFSLLPAPKAASLPLHPMNLLFHILPPAYYEARKIAASCR
jgi:hypothetical protein